MTASSMPSLCLVSHTGTKPQPAPPYGSIRGGVNCSIYKNAEKLHMFDPEIARLIAVSRQLRAESQLLIARSAAARGGRVLPPLASRAEQARACPNCGYAL